MKFDSIADAYEHYSSLLDADGSRNLLAWFLMMKWGPYGNFDYPVEYDITNVGGNLPIVNREDGDKHVARGLIAAFVDNYANLMDRKDGLDGVCWKEFLHSVSTMTPPIMIWYQYFLFGEPHVDGFGHFVYVPVEFDSLWDEDNHYMSYHCDTEVDGDVDADSAECLWSGYIRPCLEMALGGYREDSDGDFYIPVGAPPPRDPDPPDGKGGEDPPDDEPEGSDGSEEDEEPKMPTGYKAAIEELIDDGEKEKQETGDPGDPQPPPEEPPKELPKVKDSFKSFTKRLCKYV